VNFFIWGAWHAVGLFVHKAFSDQTRRRQIKWRGTWKAQAFHVFSVLLTFHFVLLGWVFFVFANVQQSLAFFMKMGGFS
jgi:alginate O-acetyltransferase complex protein AlgI